MQHRIITVEGNIGSGKTSFAKKIADDLKARLILETFADNPFLQKFFVKQKDYALGMEMFFMAERYEQLKENFNDAELFEETIVIDYLFTKSLLYAKVNLDETEFELYRKIFNILNPKIVASDLIIYLHSNSDRLINNIVKRGREFEQTVQADYLRKIEAVYLDYFNEHPNQKTVVLDVSEADFIENKNHYAKMVGIISSNLPDGISRYKI